MALELRSIMLLATDQAGSVLCVVAAELSNVFAYAPFGYDALTDTLTLSMFNGEAREPHSCCYLLGNGYRIFNPGIGRFHTPDSLSPFGEGGVNVYTYCSSDPINNTDPSGHVGAGLIGKTLSFADDLPSKIWGNHLITNKILGNLDNPSLARLSQTSFDMNTLISQYSSINLSKKIKTVPNATKRSNFLDDASQGLQTGILPQTVSISANHARLMDEIRVLGKPRNNPLAVHEPAKRMLRYNRNNDMATRLKLAEFSRNVQNRSITIGSGINGRRQGFLVANNNLRR